MHVLYTSVQVKMQYIKTHVQYLLLNIAPFCY